MGSKKSQNLPHPYLTCEAVLSEAWFLLEKFPADQEKPLKLIENKHVQNGFDLSGEIDAVAALLRRYDHIPMSIADACLVRMSELHASCVIFSTGSDFQIYRRQGNQIIPALLPRG